MKKSTLVMKVVLLILIAFITNVTISQSISKFTPYEELPSSQKMLKPEYSADMPAWAKMLYQYPVNFNEITRAYNVWEAKELQKTGAEKVRNPLVRYYKIWCKTVEPYTQLDGTIVMPDLNQLNENLKHLQENSRKPMRAPAAGNTSNWSFLGPKQTIWFGSASSMAPWQSNIYAFDYALSNNDILFCGTETGYVNKTTDNGINWQQVGRNYHFGGAVGGVTIHPANADTVLVGAGGTVHKTTDGGLTWARTSAAFSVNRIKYNALNPRIVIAAAWNGTWVSNNGGDTWTRRSANDVWDVEYKPNSVDTIYALTKDASNKFMFIQSNNRGVDFAKITTFPDSIDNHSGGLLAVTPKNPNIVYAIMLANNQNKRPFIYKGTYANNNWTWELKYVGSDGAFTSGTLTNGQGYFDLVLEVSPANENIIFAGTTSLFKSLDGARSFTAVGGYAGPFSIHPDIQDMKFLPAGGIWVSTDGGMNISRDNFTYTSNYRPSVNGIVGSDFWGFDQGWNEDITVGGRYHNGNTVISPDYYGDKALRMGGGESPTGWVLLGKSRRVAFDDLGDGYILPKGLAQWEEGRFIFSKHPNMDGYGGNRSNIATHPNYSGTLYCGSGNSVWISKDYGVTYDLLYTFPDRVRYLNISTSNPNVLYVDVVSNGIYRTQDGGTTWVKKTQPVNWGGNVAFTISPYNADYVYACMQTGSNWGDVYRTKDGGTTWEKWSNFNTRTKSIIVQPTTDGKDLVYLFTTGSNGQAAKVYIKKDGDAAWTDFDTNYPAGMLVNIALPFFRDSKIRVSGNAGIWESPMAEPDFTPVMVPWADKQIYTCTKDTVYLDSHSMINQSGVTWNWEISPAPTYISNANSRNPKAVFANPGFYTVKLSATKNGTTYSGLVNNMFQIKDCPSIYTCDNPGELPKNEWKLISVDSFQPGNEGAKAFDGNMTTLWHTAWNPDAPLPHNIQIDLGNAYNLSSMTYFPRTDGSNGRIKKYELYLSMDKTNWGTAVKVDSFINSSAPQKINFQTVKARYVKFVALTEVNGNKWTSVAELSFTGCLSGSGIEEIFSDETIKAFPIPAISTIKIELPFQNGTNHYSYSVYSVNGKLMEEGKADESQTHIQLSLQKYSSGYYLMKLKDKTGINYRVKFIKK